MKKLIAILLSVIILVCTSVLVQAEDMDYESRVYSSQQVYYYDAEKGPGCYWMNFEITTTQLDVFERVEYDITINRDIVELHYVTHGNIGLYFRDIKETATGFLYTTALRDGAPSDSVTVVLDIMSAGDINFDVTATGYYPDGTHKQLNIDLKKPYDKVVDIEELEFLDKDNFKDKFEYAAQFAIIEPGTTAGQLMALSSVESAAVVNADGEILDADKPVPTGAILATLYDGFVVDSFEFVVRGDANCDGKITAADARFVLRYCAKLESVRSGLNLAQEYAIIAVGNGNRVTAADARAILRKAAGLE